MIDVDLIAPQVKLWMPQLIVPEEVIDVDVKAPQVKLFVPQPTVPVEKIDVDDKAPKIMKCCWYHNL